MPDSAYEIAALAARYWFILIILFILFRIVENSIGEYRYAKLLKREIGRRFLGSLDVLTCDVGGYSGRRFGIRRENVIGRSKRCDIRIPSEAMEASAGMVAVRGSKLLLIDTSARHGIEVNGQSVTARQTPLRHGDEIRLGGTVFYVNLEGSAEEPEKKRISEMFKRGDVTK